MKINYLVGLFSIAMLSIFGSLFLIAGMLYINDTLFNFELDKYKATIWLCLSLIVFVVMLRNTKESYDSWFYSKPTLTKGTIGNIEFDLGNIEYIAFGIPKPKYVSFLQKFSIISPDTLYASSITIKFNDNSYLIFNTSMIDNGIELLNEILFDYQDKIVEDYSFTKDEIQILKIKESNKLLRM